MPLLRSSELPETLNEINKLGFGLTMGFHSRIESRINWIKNKAKVGNLYIYRNQIGAVVGVQPFGGEDLSGTGPKASGPHYLMRLSRKPALTVIRKSRNASKLWTAKFSAHERRDIRLLCPIAPMMISNINGA